LPGQTEATRSSHVDASVSRLPAPLFFLDHLACWVVMGVSVSVASASGAFSINRNAGEKVEKGSAHLDRNRVLRERTDTDFVLRALLRRGERTRDISTGAAVVPKVCTSDTSVGDRLPSTERCSGERCKRVVSQNSRA